MVGVTTDTLFSEANDKPFYNDIRIVDMKICVSYKAGMITYKADWIYTMTSKCENSDTACTGAPMDTMYAKYKATAGGGTDCGTDSAAKRLIIVTEMIDTMKAVWDVQVTVISNTLVSTANFDTMWTAIKGSNVFNVTNGDTDAYKMIDEINPTVNFSSAYRAAGNAGTGNAAKTT